MTDTLRTHLAMIDRRTVGGFVLDPADPARRYVVEIIADGTSIGAVIADTFNSALAGEGAADPHHGFVLTLADKLATSTRTITARLANGDVAVGRPIDLDGGSGFAPSQAPAGRIETVADASISGWLLAPTGTTAMTVHAVTAGEEIATAVARTWVTRPLGGENRAVLAFTLKIPTVLLDGATHTLDVRTSAGLALDGSPVKLPAPPA